MKNLPLIEMVLPVNGHLESIYDPSMAACGVLKPKNHDKRNKLAKKHKNTLTKSDGSVVSWGVGLLLGEDSL